MKMSFDPSLMQAGYQLAHYDTLYTLVAIEPYTRKTDGKPSQIARWRGSCPDCQTSRDILTSLRSGDLPQRCRPCFQKRRDMVNRLIRNS